MKKIINSINDIVLEMCHGLVLAHPELALDETYKIVYRKDQNPDKVAIISGGGSGHEPAHAGFVGYGMLDAAVCGDIFASPSQIQVYQAIRRVATESGVLVLIKNYSGDMMNFKNAIHLAQEDGILVDYVKIDDDIAVQDSLYTVGNRGVAGTVLVEKIVGAAAESGKKLHELKELAQTVVDNVKSIGVALTSCTVPSKGTPTFKLAEDELEFGVGIHGEPGIERIKLATADALSDKLLELLLQQLPNQKTPQKVALLVNGFGATPLMELYILNHSVAETLNQKGVQVQRTFVGNYMTSIDMAGASVTLLKLTDKLEELLDLPSTAPGFVINPATYEADYFSLAENQKQSQGIYQLETDSAAGVIGKKMTVDNIIFVVDKMAESIIKNEVLFCELDAHAGDGDFGMSVAKGFRVLKDRWQEILDKENLSISEFLHECSLIIMEHCGGASGPIWGSAFRAASKNAATKSELSVLDIANMLQAVVKGIQDTGERSFGRGAVVGDKTLIDALSPCADSWVNSARENLSFKQAFEKGAESAVEGAAKTAEFSAKMGRAGTVGERSIGYPDAGAHALGVIFTDIANAVS